jgi:DNA-binding MarR family transcriptional regulator
MVISRRPRNGPASRAESRAIDPATQPAAQPATTGVGPDADAIHDAAEQLAGLWLRSHTAANERVSTSQLRALLVVQREGPLPVSQLADELGAMVSSASRLCDRLVAAGLVERQASPVNRRLTLIRLNHAGVQLLRDIRTARVAELGVLLSRLSRSEREGLLGGLLALGQAEDREEGGEFGTLA